MLQLVNHLADDRVDALLRERRMDGFPPAPNWGPKGVGWSTIPTAAPLNAFAALPFPGARIRT